MHRLVDEADVLRAVGSPPEDTRAFFRGNCLSRYADQVAAASWDSVIFDVGRETLQRVPMLEPLRGTKAHVGELFDRCESAAELVDALTTP
jgi:proteasome accessory factor A